jgi:serine/threonine protein kinase
MSCVRSPAASRKHSRDKPKVRAAAVVSPAPGRKRFAGSCWSKVQLRDRHRTGSLRPVIIGNALSYLQQDLALSHACPTSDSAIERTDSIGKYRLLRELGRGATSIVYLARDRLHERDVAIKVIHADQLDGEESMLFQRMFFTEATLVGRLKHPHVVELLDAGIDDNDCYIVMEYVEGSTLEAHCAPERLASFDAVADIVHKCCKGLGFAHRHGLVHRDIKPANILVSRDGRIKVTDFGSAVSTKASNFTHVAGLGSVVYMSPQQIRGNYPLTYHTDIYSLGIVLFKMLTGRTPFSSESLADLAEEITGRDVTAPSKMRSAVPPQLDAIVRRATARDLGNRYGTWDQFAADLAIFSTGDLRKASVISETEKFQTLRELPLLAGLSDDEIRAILPGTAWREFPADTRVLSEGDEGYSFSILVEGDLKVMKGGRQVGEIHRGDWFGEIAYLTRGRVRRTANVVSTSSVRTVEFNPDLVWVLLKGAERRIDAMLLDRLARRLIEANENLSRINPGKKPGL